MTELQSSPSGYRGQDEGPGLPACSPNSFVKSYTSHSNPVEISNYKGAGPHSQDTIYSHQQQQQQQHNRHHNQNNNNKHQQQSVVRGSSPGEHYRKKTERRSLENENTNEDNGAKKLTTIIGYNEGFKKNTPGYKNDSGYSESIGFDTFNLLLNERDEASPPPTPPVRDASSLKSVCYGPGHEKYPSWPSAPEPRSQDDVNTIGHSGSHRSKSWTDHTNYPKEKPAQYTRPVAKRPNAAFTQQLKTVMEKCEKIPAETFESRSNRNSLEDDQPRVWPRVDREGKPLGDTEYVVPSPPEREQQQPSQTLSHADLEAYVRSYQDPQVTQVDIYRETTLTQAGLEEYTRVQHSQQASYAQSEGYHSYVSSVDSTTNTPFLDRLRRDSEAVSQRAAPSWEEACREGRDSVVTTSSGGSASSSETLKWHGSMSDVSVSSGLPSSQVNNNSWPHGSMSDMSSVNGVIGIQKPENDNDKWQGSINNVSSSMINHSSNTKHRHGNDNKWHENKWQMTMNDRNCKELNSRTSLPAVISHCASVNDVCQAVIDRESMWFESSIDDESSHDRSRTIQRGWESCLNVDHARYNQNSRLTPHSPTSHSQQQLPQHNISDADEWNPLHGSMSDVSQTNISIHGSSKQLIAHSARVQTPQRHHSESVLYLDRERSQRKLYLISTTQPQESGQGTRISPVSPQQGHLSVAERISELEKQQQQQMRYTYLDPDKRHRVSDPTLKAIQKKALLSFYERHHQSSWRSEPQLAQDTSPTPQSPPPQPPPRPRPPSSRRASSASDYASGIWREKTNRTHNNELSSPKHQHSNSCGSLSSDLLGPVIVGPVISIDDWVPERPPKKPHLRAVYNDRVPSPDLPPPSPPTVTENEVLNCDDPLPPPPPPLSELNERNTDISNDNTQHESAKRHCRNQQITRSSTRKSKHNKRSSDKSSPVSSPTQNISKSHINDNNFVRSGTLKSTECDFHNEKNGTAGYATHRMIPTGRSSLRYPTSDKLTVNGRLSSSRRILDDRNMSRPPARLPDLVSQRYSDSGNQRPAPQVPVESRIIRQESMRIESTRMNTSRFLTSGDSNLEHCLGQRPQPQVPKNNGTEKGTSYVQTSNQQTTHSNYLSLADSMKNPKYSESLGYPVGTPVKTSYEANTKLLAEANPQKYHEPPKYTSNHHQRHIDQATQRNYCVLPPKYIDAPKQIPQPQCPDRYTNSQDSSTPPPLAPRQNTPGRKCLPVPPRPAPPPQPLPGSQSKASYLAYKRERGAPDSEGSYKRTMSPTARLEDWPPPRECDDPVLLRVTPNHQYHRHHHHHHHQLHHHHNHNHNHHDLPKSHSVDALHHRIEERTNAHSVEVIGKLSHELSKKLQASDTRPRSENNNNNSIINNNDCHEDRLHQRQEATTQRQAEKRFDYVERLSPESIEALNDRNRQLEREHRKLATSCEPLNQPRHHLGTDVKIGSENLYRERSATIEITSRNVELLNRRNAQSEKRNSATATTITEFERTSSETIESIENRSSLSDKSLQTITSPSKFVKIHESGDSPTFKSRGAVPRRSGSCSSSSSSSTRSSLEQVLIQSRPSFSKTYPIDSSVRSENRISQPEMENIKRIPNPPSPRKVSSPAQTENSWTKFGCSQTCTLVNNRLRRTSSSDSRSSSMSSTSKISSTSLSSISPRYSPVDNSKVSPCVSPQPGIEGLTLVQRTEVVLRVNAITMDVASQTETMDEDEFVTSKDSVENQVLPVPRKKLPEEIECEELSRDLASQLGPNDKLVPILVPTPEHKKPTDYVSGLFRVETTLTPRLRRPLSLGDTISSSSSSDICADDDKKSETMPSTSTATLPLPASNANSPLSPTSAYFTTSESKARFLTRYSQDMSNSEDTSVINVPSENVNVEDIDLKQKKEELVLRLDRKVVVLRAEQEAVREEGELNETLGTKVSTRIAEVARPAEASKYRLHVEEIGKITSLLLGLSGRLARAENALHGMPADHPERKCLEGKRDKLLEQLEEAKILKCNIDKRSVNVSAILSKYLNDEEFADYQHFITMKTKLIMDGREIQDKVKLGEEQLAALKEAIG